MQSGGGGGLVMRVAVEVEVQLGSGSSIEEAAVVVGVEGAAAEVPFWNALFFWFRRSLMSLVIHGLLLG